MHLSLQGALLEQADEVLLHLISILNHSEMLLVRDEVRTSHRMYEYFQKI
jgi:hypothetical protein